jgi:3-methyladenine DNA glycosylase AlkD
MSERLAQILESEDETHSPQDYSLVLDTLLQHTDETVRHNCIFQLKIWNDPKPDARNALLSLIKEWNFSSNTISELLETIQTLNFNDSEMVDALSEHIQDRGYCVADTVAYTLGVLNNPTPKVLAALEWALTAGEMYFAEDFIHASAAWALGQLGIPSPSIVAGLQALAKSSVQKEREAATNALKKLGILSSTPQIRH